MDFFSGAHGAQANDGEGSTDLFARAIDARFSAASKMPVAPPPSLSLPRNRPSSQAPAPATSAAAPTSTEFPSVTPAQLDDILSDPHTLTLDLRTAPAHASARLPSALLLSVPSTLLKRPLFGTDRIGAMLPSPAARERFGKWREAGRVLLYDADGAGVTAGSNLLGLLKKFAKEKEEGGGKGPEIVWLRGGFQAVWRERRALVDERPLSDDEDDDSPSPPSSQQQQSQPAPHRAPHPTLRMGALPTAAFNASSTTSQRAGSTHHSAAAAGGGAPRAAASNPFYDNVRQNLELSQGATDRIVLKIDGRAKRRVQELPFGWLREIGEWAGIDGESSEGESSEGGEGESGPESGSKGRGGVRFGEGEGKEKQGAEALAMQFYRIELGEQRRLMGVMEHHSRESNTTQPIATQSSSQELEPRRRTQSFPYSITAGVEKGTKNRYRNIWPFEHARVRLANSKGLRNKLRLPPTTPGEDDYVNASYVQPLGTEKRYIATQGPLEDTFADFWTLVWEQNVHVIVMLTREVEGATVKSGNYWSGAQYGKLRLKLVSEEGALGKQGAEGGAHGPSAGGFFFPAPDAPAASERPAARPVQASAPGEDADLLETETTIRRVLELKHDSFPDAPPRRVVQLQYLAWPDMNVPESTDSILRLMQVVEREVERGGAPADADGSSAGTPSSDSAASGSGEGSGSGSSGGASDLDSRTGIQRRARRAPVLLHCSAGVGRTGGFIAVDAVLDGIRRELRAHGAPAASESSPPAQEQMEVDAPPALPARGSASGLVMSLGDVHVPLAGAADAGGDAGEGVDMDVDDAHAPWTAGDPAHAVTRWAEHPTPLTASADPHALRSPSGILSASSASLAPSAAPSTSASPFPRSPPPPARPRTPESSPGAASGMAAMNLDLSPLQAQHQNATQAARARRAPERGMRLSFGAYPGPEQAAQPTARGYPSPAHAGPSFSGHRAGSAGSSGESSGGGGAGASGSGSGGSAEASVVGLGVGGERSRRGSSTLGAGVGEMRIESPRPGGAQHKDKALSIAAAAAAAAAGAVERAGSAESSGGSVGDVGSSGDGAPAGSSPGTSARASQSSSKLAQRAKGSGDGSGGSSLLAAATATARGESSSTARGTGTSNGKSPKRGAGAGTGGAARMELDGGGAGAGESGVGTPPTLDYAMPRALHDDARVPVALSSLDEPIRRVLEDMREQRMSLCQSLRQYVFVHRAVLEGALALLDAERARGAPVWDDRGPRVQPDASASASSGAGTGTGAGPGAVDSSASPPSLPVSASSTGKRGPSPTELGPAEGADKGLAKRASVKRRKARAASEEG